LALGTLLFLVPLALITEQLPTFSHQYHQPEVFAVFVFKFWGSVGNSFCRLLLVFVAYLVSDISLQLISEGTSSEAAM